MAAAAAADFCVDVFEGEDGSKYYGTLKGGMPDGLGTRIWPDGSQYDGEWRAGHMHGFGTYVWKSGQRYDGEFRDGQRNGIGVKTYADGSMYDGFWSNNKKHGLGVYRPSPSGAGARRSWQSHADTRASNTGSGGGGAREHSPPHGRASELHGAALEGGGDESAHVTMSDPSAFCSPLPGSHLGAAASSANGSSGLDSGTAPPPAGGISGGSSGNGSAAGAPGAGVGPGASAGGGVVHGATGAPLSLLIREYDEGELLREDALSAEEIKLIFGCLWPKPKTTVGQRVRRLILRKPPRHQMKLGEVVYKGHNSYQLMLNLQLGIRYSVGRMVRPKPAESHTSGSSFLVHSAQGPTSSAASSPRAAAPPPATPPSAASIGSSPLGRAVAAPPPPPRPRSRFFSFSCVAPPLSSTRTFSAAPPPLAPQHALRGVSNSTLATSASSPAPLGVPAQPSTAASTSSDGSWNGALGLWSEEFDERIKLSFPSRGSSKTPAHPSADFKFKDYCPAVFRALRAAFAIDDADYVLSLAGSQALRQLNSPGKSGSVFFLSEDQRFLVKTMRKSEMRVLLGLLPRYCTHVASNPDTLITRFFGLHRIRVSGGTSVRFVVMANIFVTDLQIHRRYDIKGSTDGRTAGPAAADDPNAIFKDLDIDFRLALEPGAHEVLQRQLASDCQLLRECGVMDYSLLLGVHYPARTGCKLSMEHAVSMDTATAAAAAVTAVANTDKAAGNAGGGAGMHSQHLRSALAALSEPPPTLSSHLRRTSDSDGELGPLPPLGPWAAARSGSGSAAAGGLPLFLASERVTSEDVAGAGFGAGGGVGGGPAGDRARNFELHSAAAEDEEQLSVIQQRMQRLGFSEQRMKDIAELARLKILGGKLKKSAVRKEPPAKVLAAMQRQRQEASEASEAGGMPMGSSTGGGDLNSSLPAAASPTAVAAAVLPALQRPSPLISLSSMRGVFSGLQVPPLEDEEEELPAPWAGVQQWRLGINNPAMALPQPGSEGIMRPPEEVVVSFGIIDILQDYSMRKVVERQVKSLNHDSYSISVAPPKVYARRFLEFVRANVFADKASEEVKRQSSFDSRLAGSFDSRLPHSLPSAQLPTLQEQAPLQGGGQEQQGQQELLQQEDSLELQPAPLLQLQPLQQMGSGGNGGVCMDKGGLAAGSPLAAL